MPEPSQKPAIVVFGGGGHAKVVIDAIESQNKFEILGIVDPFSQLETLRSYPVKGDVQNFLPGNFVVAIGDNARRKALFNEMVESGWTPQAVLHPSAILSRDVIVGAGSIILAGAVANAASVIGENCIINTAATIDHDCEIGSHSHLAPGCHLAGNVRIAEGCFLGIGTNVIPKIRIGSWSIAGAGSTVISDVAPKNTVVGVPARPINKAPSTGDGIKAGTNT